MWKTKFCFNFHPKDEISFNLSKRKHSLRTMSAAVLSNNASSQLKWEQVGSKKRQSTNGSASRPSAIPTLSKSATKTQQGKMPTIDSLPPIRVEKSIYDLLDREDSSDDDEKKFQQKNKPQKVSNENIQAAAAAKKSPKQQKQQSTNNQNSLRLTASSSTAQQSTLKKQETDLSSVMSTLNLSDFNQEYTTFLTLYPNAHSMAMKHMISFLNSRLNSAFDVEPTFNNENDFTTPLSKMDKKLKDFYTTLMNKLNKSECENVFEYIVSETLNDTKSTSTHGYKMIAQLIVSKSPDLPLKYLEKFEDEINANRHRHQRCLIVLWIIGQCGYLSLEAGLKVWFNLMVKHISIKQYTTLVISYLNHLLEFHKVKTNLKENEFLSIRQYFDFYDLLDDKTVLAALNKETNAKLQNCFKNLHDLLLKQSKAKYSDYFEAILVQLPLESSKKQAEVLECAKLCLVHGKDTYTKWRQIYSKYLKQTQILLKQISKQWSEFYSSTTSHDLKQSLKYFEQNSSFYLKNSLQTSKQQKQNQIKNSKTSAKQQQLSSSDVQQMQAINTLTKIQKQLPTLTDNLTSLFYLFLNYLSTLYGFLMHYFNLLINFVETKLFGLKHGELAIVFTDGLKQMFNYLSDFFKWLNESK